MALLAFKNAYRRAGLELGPGELPDHLAVVLEFAATADPEAGRQLLLDHRAGIELLRLALDESGSPYAHVLQAVTRDPAARCAATSARRSARLAAEGPPAEEVGLAPFAPPEYMPPAEGGAAMSRSSGSPCPTPAWPSSPSATSGATATTSSAGPPARRSSTSRACSGWAPRSSTSASSFVLGGHVMGLGMPKSWTEAVGISEGAYHVMAVGVGSRRRVLHAGRDGDPHLPPPHGRPGVLRDDPDGQGDVPRPRHGHRARPGEHGRRRTSSATTTTARASRSGSAASSASPRIPS